MTQLEQPTLTLTNADEAHQKQLRADYAAAFGSEAGQRILDDLMVRCHVGAHLGMEETVNYTHYCLGQRSVVLHILYMMRADVRRAVQRQYDQQG